MPYKNYNKNNCYVKILQQFLLQIATIFATNGNKKW